MKFMFNMIEYIFMLFHIRIHYNRITILYSQNNYRIIILNGITELLYFTVNRIIIYILYYYRITAFIITINKLELIIFILIEILEQNI